MIENTGRITYRTTTIEEEQAAHVASFLGFNEVGRTWFVYRLPHLSVNTKKTFEKRNIQVYLPTYKCLCNKGGKKVVEERPKILNYLFVLATLQEIQEIQKEDDICPVYRHHNKGEIMSHADTWLTVPSKQMRSLMLVVEGFEREVEFTTPDSHTLAKGDKVKVVGGKFNGLEGILLSNQRAGGGNIFVDVTYGTGLRSAHIPDRYIKVLEVSRDSNRFFRRIEAFEHLMNDCFIRLHEGKNITEEQRAGLEFFVFRYSELTGLTHVNKTKLTTCQYVAYTLLHKQQQAEQCLQQYQEQVNETKSSRRAARRSPTAQQYMNSWFEKLNVSHAS